MFGGIGRVGFGGGAAFNPRRLVQRYDGAWYRADLGVTGSPVTDWADFGGVSDGTNRTASWVTSKPTFNATSAAFGNRPSLSFGANDRLVTPNWSSAIAPPFTVWVVAKIPSAAIMYAFDANAVGQRHSIYYANDGTFRMFGTGSTLGYADGANGMVFAAAFAFNGASSRVWNLSDVGMTDGDPGNPGSPLGITIGNYAGGGAGGMELAELAVFKAALSDAEVRQLMAYAQAWFGIRTILSSARDLSSVHVYHRADVVTLAGRGVGTWADQSGAGDANRDLVQATDASRPLYRASDAELGGAPSVFCENAGAGTSWMQSGTWSAASTVPFTTFTVGKASVGYGAANPYMWDAKTTNQVGLHGISPVRYYAGGADSLSGDDMRFPFGHVITQNGASSISWWRSSNSDIGVPYASGFNPGTNTMTGLTLGCYLGALGNTLYNWHGPIGEWALWNRALAKYEARQLLSYARARYPLV